MSENGTRRDDVRDPEVAIPGWTPRPVPQPVALRGRWCRLEPLGPQHADTLFAASSAPGAQERFRYLPEPPPDRTAFDAWLDAAVRSADPLFFAVLDATTGRAEGRQSLLRTVEAHGVTEIGHILWGPAISRTRVATEALYLFARYVFDDLGYRRFEWKCNALNAPSRRAALRFGFSFEGVFRQHMVVKGHNRDTAWFAMTDGDWAWLAPAYAAWLAEDNFTADGTQRTALADRIAASRDAASSGPIAGS